MPRKMSIIHFLSLGEGPRPGPAHRIAQLALERNRNLNIVAVDVNKLQYKPPRNMVFHRMDAIKFLQSREDNSVQRIRDDFSFQYISMGKWGKTIEGAFKYLDIVNDTARHGKPLPKRIPDPERNRMLYFSQIFRVLVPGGRVTFTTGEISVQNLQRVLTQIGFVVRAREPSPTEIGRKGSVEAKATGERIF